MPDRETFFKEVSSALDFLLMHPASAAQKNITLALVFLVLIFSLSKLHRWGRAARSGFFPSLAAVSVSVFFLAVIAVWGGYGIAELGLVKGQQTAALAIVLGAAFFAGVAPWTRLCFKSAYFTSVAAWILALLLAAGAVYLSRSAWRAAGGAGTEKASADFRQAGFIPRV